MASKDEVPASLEGAKILVCGLKIVPVAHPVKYPKIGSVFRFAVQRRGNGTIEEGNGSKEPSLRPYSFLETGDKISGQELWGFSTVPIKPGDIQVGQAGRSGGHSGQDMTSRGRCFLELIHGWRGTPLLEHPHQRFLSIENEAQASSSTLGISFVALSRNQR